MKNSEQWAEEFGEFLTENGYPEIDHGVLVSWFTRAMHDAKPINTHAISGIYKNYRGEVSKRNVIPQELIYMTDSEYHGEGYILRGIDTEKNEVRDFALSDFNFLGIEEKTEEDRILGIAAGVIHGRKADVPPSHYSLDILVKDGYLDVVEVCESPDGNTSLLKYKITPKGIQRIIG